MRGRQTVCQLDARRLRVVHAWLEDYRAFWESAPDRLDSHLTVVPPMERS